MTNILSAMDIITKHQMTYPVRVVPIANELGIDVYRVDNWNDNISGKLTRKTNDRTKFTIYVNGRHSLVRQRFTISHEIAHFILHQDLISEELLDDALYRSGLSNSVEAAANKLAADILMPWHLINAAIDSGINTLPELARRFDVSQAAMAIRLGVPSES